MRLLNADTPFIDARDSISPFVAFSSSYSLLRLASKALSAKMVGRSISACWMLDHARTYQTLALEVVHGD
jgi:hypothetical protein